GKFAFIHREDAFDWDVIGHEFTHVLTSTFSARGGRVIDANPGGVHSGGSAIGQDDGTGHLRTREEGMQLAWSEGLAPFFGLALQSQPVSATVPFPSPLLTVGNALFEETEDVVFVIDPENPVGNEGFGSEESVLAVFWDLFDSARDTDALSGAADAIDGVTV